MVSVKCAGSGVSRGHTATSVGRNLMIVNAKGIQLNIYIYIRMAAYKGSGRWEVWEHWVHIPFVCARSFIFGWVVWFPFDRQRADSPIPFSLGCVCVCVCDSAVYPYSGNLPFPMVWLWLSALPFDAPLNWFHDNHCSINTGQSACVVQTEKTSTPVPCRTRSWAKSLAARRRTISRAVASHDLTQFRSIYI